MMKITNITGGTITFETPFYYTFQVALGAQHFLTFDATNYPISVGLSVENLGLFGGEGGDGEGNLAVGLCASCWGSKVSKAIGRLAPALASTAVIGVRYATASPMRHLAPTPAVAATSAA